MKNGFELLREKNNERQKIWCPDPSNQPDLSFRGNELGGEVGEAQNVIKKLERERHGWPGSRDTVEPSLRSLPMQLSWSTLLQARSASIFGRLFERNLTQPPKSTDSR